MIDRNVELKILMDYWQASDIRRTKCCKRLTSSVKMNTIAWFYYKNFFFLLFHYKLSQNNFQLFIHIHNIYTIKLFSFLVFKRHDIGLHQTQTTPNIGFSKVSCNCNNYCNLYLILSVLNTTINDNNKNWQ